MIGVGLRLLGVRCTYLLLGGADSSKVGGTDVGDDSHATAQRLGRLVNIASRHGPYSATCLRQSLALWWLLRRRGVTAELRIGVGKEEEQILAHAWVELHGNPINDSASVAEQYAAYPVLDARLRGVATARRRSTWHF
jgi:hypothetical protein